VLIYQLEKSKNTNDKMSTALLIAIFIVTTLCLVGMGSYRTGSGRVNQCGDFINGFWKADPGWCAKAGISNAYATINFFPEQKYGVIYLLMQNGDGQIVDNDSYKFKTTVTMKEMLFNSQGNTECHLVFQDGKNPVSGAFPMSCKLRVDIRNGVLALHDDNTVYLELYKDNMTSSRVERMSIEKYKETYLPERPRSDPQQDHKEPYLPERPRSDPQADVEEGLGEINGEPQEFKTNSEGEGENIMPPVDESEGMAI
jgi:hypothetical protein